KLKLFIKSGHLFNWHKYLHVEPLLHLKGWGCGSACQASCRSKTHLWFGILQQVLRQMHCQVFTAGDDRPIQRIGIIGEEIETSFSGGLVESDRSTNILVRMPRNLLEFPMRCSCIAPECSQDISIFVIQKERKSFFGYVISKSYPGPNPSLSIFGQTHQ